MKENSAKEPLPAKPVLIEIAVYGVLVLIYSTLVLSFLGDKVKEVYDHSKTVYAAVALALMVSQGVGLDFLTSWLLRLVKRKSK